MRFVGSWVVVCLRPYPWAWQWSWRTSRSSPVRAAPAPASAPGRRTSQPPQPRVASVVVQIGSGTHAGSLVALRLPGELPVAH